VSIFVYFDLPLRELLLYTSRTTLSSSIIGRWLVLLPFVFSSGRRSNAVDFCPLFIARPYNNWLILPFFCISSAPFFFFIRGRCCVALLVNIRRKSEDGVLSQQQKKRMCCRRR
jgi:hypothetical protein